MIKIELKGTEQELLEALRTLHDNYNTTIMGGPTHTQQWNEYRLDVFAKKK
ncbi:HLA class I histocompatibility antigen alpha chain family protein [Bacillus sp. HMF5848]|uniref:HLA class I histocompatibility antigen alpha chain family protein n=1 Tax=Bacillus sp. HMF5848 TaxID=2495421 RepID=UPI00115F7BD7|nr:HLA class I histocompatibility antigen alpha chain family protein [Bacillus sp. HMF5848]